MTHTLAPWDIELPNSITPHIWIVAPNDNGGVAKIETCNYDDGKGERHTESDFANARLIAAAPDLLAACAAAEDYLAAIDELAAQQIYDQLHAAIKRAKTGA